MYLKMLALTFTSHKTRLPTSRPFICEQIYHHISKCRFKKNRHFPSNKTPTPTRNLSSCTYQGLDSIIIRSNKQKRDQFKTKQPKTERWQFVGDAAMLVSTHGDLGTNLLCYITCRLHDVRYERAGFTISNENDFY